ncbi:MAG TPA: CHRD domain-containing protein, partial [Gemmatimonadaceae bacterium]|nr:CHRD domain-containing protein [Gemmatimonadaceae bacterium]
TMLPGNETPPKTTTGTGVTTFVDNGTEIDWTMSLTGVVGSGSITNANNVNISLDSLRVLFNNGNAYVNVHTTANGAGEIRGQIALK